MVCSCCSTQGCPIEQVSSRVKSFDRIVAKARRVGWPLTPEWVRRTILDIAGVRVVFSKPKPNGYKSLHMTIEIPVLMPDGVQVSASSARFDPAGG